MAAVWIILMIVIIAYLMSPKKAEPITYLPLSISKNYLAPVHWKGMPVDRKGRFVNEEYPFYQNYLTILIWLPGHILSLIRNRKTKFPVIHHNSKEVLQRDETLIWLGHASFFLRINNMNILIDPHFYNTFIYKRHSENPISPELFTEIDYILLSHDHADHCDKKSLQLLVTNNPNVTILCGSNMETLVQSFFNQKVDTITAEWYEEISISPEFKIYFVPGRHYSKRIFEKFNSRLWGGFVLQFKTASGNSQTLYYAGDSGYGSHFKEVGKLFHPDVTILPIGAYLPRWFMKANHISPEEAIQAFEDSGASLMIPMHYGTFNLSNERMEYPKKNLAEKINPLKIADLKPGSIVHKNFTLK